MVVQTPFFEDFCEGEVLLTQGRTISRTDVVNFAAVSGDFDPLHLDVEFGKTTIFGQNVAHGLCGLTAASGLIVSSGILRNIVAFYGIDRWEFKKPLFFEDTIRVRITVEGKKEKRRGGLVRLRLELLNQRHEVLQQGYGAY